MNILIVLIALVAVSLTTVLLVIFGSNKKETNVSHKKNRDLIIKNATKKLSQDPHSCSGLIPLANLYFEEHNWAKAFPLYKTLIDIAVIHSEINLAESALRYGICAVKLNKGEEAFKGLAQAQKMDPDTFEVNYYLGLSLYLEKKYDKSIYFFKKARAIKPEALEVYDKTGLAMYYAKMYKQALPYLKRGLDINPENKELLYYLASAMNKTGSGDRAIKIFMHLRPDPKFGADSCLAASILHSGNSDIDKAIADLQIGLKHKNAPLETQLLIRYNLGQCYLKKGDLSSALKAFAEIQTMSSNYKDVSVLISRYQELNQNKKLQTYLIGGSTDYISICRQIVSIYYKGSHVKVIAIESKNNMVEIQTEIETSKWEDVVVFRFGRGTGVVGELFVREFHGVIKDFRAGRGVFITAGKFSEEAKKFAEGRPIDLIEKEALLKLLSKVSSNSLAML